MQAAITGEWRRPVNTAAHQKGGIHDDDTATDLGFRGGTVAGAIHMEQFHPCYLRCSERIFGRQVHSPCISEAQRWIESPLDV